LSLILDKTILSRLSLSYNQTFDYQSSFPLEIRWLTPKGVAFHGQGAALATPKNIIHQLVGIYLYPATLIINIELPQTNPIAEN